MVPVPPKDVPKLSPKPFDEKPLFEKESELKPLFVVVPNPVLKLLKLLAVSVLNPVPSLVLVLEVVTEVTVVPEENPPAALLSVLKSLLKLESKLLLKEFVPKLELKLVPPPVF